MKQAVDEWFHFDSIENERQVLNVLLEKATAQVEQYSTTLAQDEKLFEDHIAYPFGSNQRNALAILKHEKELLGYMQLFCNLMLKWSKLEPAELKQAIDERYHLEHPDNPSHEAWYARDVILDLVEAEHLSN